MSPDDTTTRTVRKGQLAKAPKTPQDHKPAHKVNPAMMEAYDTPQTFTWDGEEWTVVPSAATALEFLAALEDDRIIAALRLLLGKEQAARLIKGRHADIILDFFETMNRDVSLGNQ